ncbi:c-type cytochrome [Endozoicomonas sp. GU-1]|uniref:c-type cytochrome n=1 Tax=Endozoicomonas sp. GU-1 TaxID=3009078 RepID=UPI003FA44B13
MKKVILTLVISLGITGIAFAKGDAAAGKSKATTCAACHGATGVSLAPNWPNLAGQGERYLIKQITEIKDGSRSVPEMMPFVSALTTQDIADLAAYFASQPAPQGATDAKYVTLGQALYRGGGCQERYSGLLQLSLSHR